MEKGSTLCRRNSCSAWQWHCYDILLFFFFFCIRLPAKSSTLRVSVFPQPSRIWHALNSWDPYQAAGNEDPNHQRENNPNTEKEEAKWFGNTCTVSARCQACSSLTKPLFSWAPPNRVGRGRNGSLEYLKLTEVPAQAYTASHNWVRIETAPVIM